MNSNGLNLEPAARVLSAVLLEPTLAAKVLAATGIEDYPAPQLRDLFQGIGKLQAANQPIDRVGLCELNRDSYLFFDAIEKELIPRPDPSEIEKDLHRLRQETKYREAVHAVDRIYQKASNGGISAQDLNAIGEFGKQLEAPHGRPPAVVFNSQEYICRTFPEREAFVIIKSSGTPVLTGASLNQIFGWRGTGKSMFAQGLAGHISTGKPFLNFEIPKPRRVLYVDGELPSAQLQERMRLLYPPNAMLEIIDLESQGVWGIPNLATPEGQAWLERELEGVEVLFLDNQAALAPFSIRDDDAQTFWNNWLLRLRARGLCVVTIHQAGKSGNQRLTSINDDPLDVQIKLSSDENEERGHLKCVLHYEKFRSESRGSGDLNLEFQNGEWTCTEAALDKSRIVEEFLCLHPTGSAQKLFDLNPQLGSLSSVKRLIAKARK